MPTEGPKDANSDKVLSPDEYLPPTPFGTLKADAASKLGDVLTSFTQATGDLNDTMRPLLDAAKNVQAGDPEKKEIFYLSSFH